MYVRYGDKNEVSKSNEVGGRGKDIMLERVCVVRYGVERL